MNPVVKRLEDTIRDDYHCDVRHLGGVEIRELSGGSVAWHGVVEVFELAGHPVATRCYAWAYRTDDGNERRVVVLHAGSVDSPQQAVRAAVAHEYHRRSKPK